MLRRRERTAIKSHGERDNKRQLANEKLERSANDLSSVGARPKQSSIGDRWRRRGAVVLLLLLLVGLGLSVWRLGAAFGGGPAAWAAALSDQWGVEVDVGGVSLAGFNRIALHDVGVEGDVSLEARRIVAAFSVTRWLQQPGEPMAALRWVRVDDWTLNVPGAAWTPRGEAEATAFGWLADAGLPVDAFLASPDARDDASASRVDREGGGDASAERAGPSGTWLDGLQPLLDYPWLDGGLDVYAQNGRIVFGDDDGAPPVAAEGAFVLGGGRLVGRNVQAEVPGDGAAMTAAANGVLWPRPDVYVQLQVAREAGGDGVADGIQRAPFRSVGAETWVTGSWQSLHAWGTVRLQQLALPWWPDYALDEAIVQWGRKPDEPVRMAVEGRRGLARVWLQGELLADGVIDFDVAATDVRIPEDVPAVAAYDASGTVDAAGVLRGTLSDPVLEAEAAADGGWLFGEPITDLQGRLRLTKDAFAFDAVRVTQGRSEYYLNGEVGLAESTPFRVVLHTERGRAETLLSVLGWDAPVQARLAGSLRFSRPADRLVASGEVTLTRGRAWGQPFDEAAGQFRYADGAFQVKDAVASVRGGAVTASGGTRWTEDVEMLWQQVDGIAPGWDEWSGSSGTNVGAADTGGEGGVAGAAGADDWRLYVQADDVPLQAIAQWREQGWDGSGVVDFAGTVYGGEDGGAVSRVEGTLTGRHLAAGPLHFAEAEGAVAWEGDELYVHGLTLRRQGGGVYAAAGRVYDLNGNPRLALTVDVENESVEALVALSDWRLPLVAHSEPLRASGAVTGPLAAPEARLSVESDAVYVVGRPTPLALDLRWRDGRIEVENGFLRKGNADTAGT